MNLINVFTTARKRYREFRRELPHGRVTYQDFGFIVGGIFLFIALLFLAGNMHLTLAKAFMLIGGVLGFGALILPMRLRFLYVSWMSLGFVLGYVLGPVVLTIIYYLFFSPIAFMKRLMGARTPWLEYNRETKTYWIKRERHYEPKDSETLF